MVHTVIVDDKVEHVLKTLRSSGSVQVGVLVGQVRIYQCTAFHYVWIGFGLVTFHTDNNYLHTGYQNKGLYTVSRMYAITSGAQGKRRYVYFISCDCHYLGIPL